MVGRVESRGIDVVGLVVVRGLECWRGKMRIVEEVGRNDNMVRVLWWRLICRASHGCGRGDFLLGDRCVMWRLSDRLLEEELGRRMSASRDNFSVRSEFGHGFGF